MMTANETQIGGTRRQQVLPHVMADMAARIAKGADEYGEPLTTGNGRDALVDAYEEALDLALYLKQAIMERDAQRPAYGPSRESVAAVTSPESAAILADVPVIQGGWPGPDWSQAPGDVNFWAVDSGPGERAYWYTAEPTVPDPQAKAFSAGTGRLFYPASTCGYPGDWRDSLRKRPAVQS